MEATTINKPAAQVSDTTIELVGMPEVLTPGITYLSSENTKPEKASKQVAYVLKSLLETYDERVPHTADEMSMFWPDGLRPISNIGKAKLLGTTAIYFGADSVGIIDLKEADSIYHHLSQFYTEMSTTDAQLIIAAEPDQMTGSRTETVRTVERGIAVLPIPTLRVATQEAARLALGATELYSNLPS